MSRNEADVEVSVQSGVQDIVRVEVRHDETEEKYNSFVGKSIAIPDVGDGLVIGDIRTTGSEETEIDNKFDDDDTLYRVVDRVFELRNHEINTESTDKEIVSSGVTVFVLPEEDYIEQEE